MSYHQGFLYLSDGFGNPVEVINEARTAAGLAAAGGYGFHDVLADAGCSGLHYNPCTMASDGTVTSWTTLSTATTAAPWYVAGVPASAEAFGFHIEEWTGLDGGVHSRAVTPGGNSRGGAYFGPQTSAHRVMAFNVLLLGSTDRGLNHLFRWLETTLLDCCGCSKPSMWVREYCPGAPDLDPTDGLARLDGVALLAGPEWEAPPVEDGGCRIRRASFTLGAQSPCFFREPSTVVTQVSLKSAITATTTDAPADQVKWIGTSPQAVGVFTGPAYGNVSPIVTISSPYEAGKFLPVLRVVGYANPAGLTTPRIVEMPVVGAMVLGSASGVGIPAGEEVVIDFGARTVKRRNPFTSLEWSDGSDLVRLGTYLDGSAVNDDYISFSGSTSLYRRWISFGCDDGVTVVEPNITPSSSTLSTYATTWTTVIKSSVRFGCA